MLNVEFVWRLPRERGKRERDEFFQGMKVSE
jgi:hypothetical protein